METEIKIKMVRDKIVKVNEIKFEDPLWLNDPEICISDLSVI